MKNKQNGDIYLDTYRLQKDLRIRLPKSIKSNLNVVEGVSKFDIFLDSEKNNIILSLVEESVGELDDK